MLYGADPSPRPSTILYPESSFCLIFRESCRRLEVPLVRLTEGGIIKSENETKQRLGLPFSAAEEEVPLRIRRPLVNVFTEEPGGLRREAGPGLPMAIRESSPTGAGEPVLHRSSETRTHGQKRASGPAGPARQQGLSRAVGANHTNIAIKRDTIIILIKAVVAVGSTRRILRGYCTLRPW